MQYFKTTESEGQVIHPTQKPISLFEYFVRTYTEEGALVLDNCLGAGTTAVACIRTARRFVRFEKDKQYYDIAVGRIAETTSGNVASARWVS